MHLSKVIAVDCNIAVGGRICSAIEFMGVVGCWISCMQSTFSQQFEKLPFPFYEACMGFMIAIDVLCIANLPVAPHIGLICRLNWASPCFAQWGVPHYATLFVA